MGCEGIAAAAKVVARSRVRVFACVELSKLWVAYTHARKLDLCVSCTRPRVACFGIFSMYINICTSRLYISLLSVAR